MFLDELFRKKNIPTSTFRDEGLLRGTTLLAWSSGRLGHDNGWKPAPATYYFTSTAFQQASSTWRVL